MSGGWFPAWLLVLMTVTYVGITAVHVAHLMSQRGAPLLWTASHVLMGTGMSVMVLPLDRMLLSGTVVAPVFVAAALACLLVAVRTCWGAGGSQLWFLTAADLAAMAYMFAPASVRSPVVSIFLVAVLLVESVNWASGHLVGAAVRDGLVRAPDAGTRGGSAPKGSGGIGQVSTAPVGAPRATRVTPVMSVLGHPWTRRATMSVMALGMAYMLIAMAPAAPTTVGGHTHGMVGL